MELINRIRNTIRRYEMLERGDRVIVCVSGGPDSMFLFRALFYLKDEFGIRLFIANLDHGVRGRESHRDSLFVKKLAKDHKLRLFFKKLDFKKYKKLSVEETLRLKRYDFFNKTAVKYRINKIATAHTADDLAETVLMRVIKGSSIKGMIGILPKRPAKFALCIRPLIEIEKNDILNFLNKNKISYRIDRTNFDNNYFRNAVRNRIMPYLSRYNPQIKRTLVNIAESLREDMEFIEKSKRERSALIKEGDDAVKIQIKDIAIQPKAIQKEILRDALIKIGSNIKKLNFRHWKDMETLIRIKPTGKSMDLPGGVRISKGKYEMLFKKL